MAAPRRPADFTFAKAGGLVNTGHQFVTNECNRRSAHVRESANESKQKAAKAAQNVVDDVPAKGALVCDEGLID
jgi:hypothetical protein